MINICCVNYWKHFVSSSSIEENIIYNIMLTANPKILGDRHTDFWHNDTEIL
jgi:hypothetical protein